jgi:hypothetical protein
MEVPMTKKVNVGLRTAGACAASMMLASSAFAQAMPYVDVGMPSSVELVSFGHGGASHASGFNGGQHGGFSRPGGQTGGGQSHPIGGGQPPHQQPPHQEPPRQQPPRQEPPRQEPPRQQPPRQEPPRQEPPRHEPPHQEPPRGERPGEGRGPIGGHPGEPGRGPIGRPGEPGRGPIGRGPGEGHRPEPGHPGGGYRGPGPNRGGRPVDGFRGHPELIHHTLGNPRFVADVRLRVGRERDGMFHWYEHDGHRYAHWYGRGHDWFGFYVGSAFFWSVCWNNYFWWHEAAYNRWMWYHDGYWWWWGPGGVAYIYYNDVYYPWNSAPIVIVNPPVYVGEPPGDAGEPPAPADQAAVFTSPDGTRTVRVAGEQGDAYLYDATRTDARGYAVLIKYLGSGVQDVQFSQTQPLQIILQVSGQDGQTVSVPLDSNGQRLDGSLGMAAPSAPAQDMRPAAAAAMSRLGLTDDDAPQAPEALPTTGL